MPRWLGTREAMEAMEAIRLRAMGQLGQQAGNASARAPQPPKNTGEPALGRPSTTTSAAGGERYETAGVAKHSKTL